MSADPFKTLRDRQLEHQAEPVVIINPATGEATGTPSSPTVVQVSGSSLVEQLTQADVDAGDLEFAAAIEVIEIVNLDVANTGVFVVNGMSIRVPPEVAFGPVHIAGTPSATVAVSGATTYIVNRYA